MIKKKRFLKNAQSQELVLLLKVVKAEEGNSNSRLNEKSNETASSSSFPSSLPPSPLPPPRIPSPFARRLTLVVLARRAPLYQTRLSDERDAATPITRNPPKTRRTIPLIRGGINNPKCERFQLGLVVVRGHGACAK